MPEALYLKEIDNKIYIKAVGHITAALCADLRESVLSRLNSELPSPKIFIDLSACSYMDSTFLGLMVGINKRLIKDGASRLTIVNPSEPSVKLISDLGLTGLVDIVASLPGFPENMENILPCKKSNAELILKAHENLMELSAENRKKFGTLHSILSKQKSQNPSADKDKGEETETF